MTREEVQDGFKMDLKMDLATFANATNLNLDWHLTTFQRVELTIHHWEVFKIGIAN